MDKRENQTDKLNGVHIIPASEKFDPKEMTQLFTGKNIDAKKLRKELWQRKKDNYQSGF